MKKAFISAVSALVGAAIGGVGGVLSVGKVTSGAIQSWHQRSDKHLELYLVMNQWVKVKQDGKNLSSYFEKNGYKKIAIYGMHYIGETLLDELKGTGIEVAYAIDKDANQIYTDVEIVLPEDQLGAVDAIVVTPITFFDEIKEKLVEKVSCPIISLKDILYEV